MSESILSPYPDMQRRAPFAQRALVVLFSATLVACAAGPDFKQPEAPKVARFTEKPIATTLATAPNVAGGTEQQIVPDTDIPAEWWTLFKSPQLDKLIKTALEQNPNLAAADAALRVAQENVNARIGGQYFPSIGLGGSATRQQQSLATFGLPGQNIYNVYNTSINLGYRLDVFGAARRAVESARAQAEISQFQLEGAYLALTANIVTAAVREAALRAQYAATSEILKTQQNFADVTARQLAIGTVSRVDLSSQQTLVANSQVDLLAYERNLAFARNQLAVYTGVLPSNAQIAEFELANLHLPDKLPLSLPSNLVRQRPDIRAAEALLKSTNALVGVATANLLPQINLSASVGSVALSSGALFGPSAAIWSVAGGVFQPLFQGGQLLAQRRSAVAGYEQAVFQYQATVLTAFQEVADALRALETGAESLKAAADAERYSKETLDLVQEQYKLGTSSYLAVLYYQNLYQQSKIKFVQAQAVRFADTAALFAALGGGWWNRGGPAYQPNIARNAQ